MQYGTKPGALRAAQWAYHTIDDVTHAFTSRAWAQDAIQLLDYLFSSIALIQAPAAALGLVNT